MPIFNHGDFYMLYKVFKDNGKVSQEVYDSATSNTSNKQCLIPK